MSREVARHCTQLTEIAFAQSDDYGQYRPEDGDAPRSHLASHRAHGRFHSHGDPLQRQLAIAVVFQQPMRAIFCSTCRLPLRVNRSPCALGAGCVAQDLIAFLQATSGRLEALNAGPIFNDAAACAVGACCPRLRRLSIGYLGERERAREGPP